jgi:putative hydrolase of the HAD superfamily
MNTPHPTALLFDYGNTLIAFGPDQQQAQLQAMRQVLDSAGIEVDSDALDALRKEQVLRPYQSDGVENRFEDVCAEVVALGRTPPPPAVVQDIMRARREAFLQSITVKDEVLNLLDRLRGRYRLGLLSNYPCTRSIVDSLKAVGLLPFFETVVVSADVGFAKPHPAPYLELLQRMDLRPEEAVYIGDNWLADIQGAGRQGLRTVWVREHIPYEVFEPQDGDLPATGVVETLTDLETLLETW